MRCFATGKLGTIYVPSYITTRFAYRYIPIHTESTTHILKRSGKDVFRTRRHQGNVPAHTHSYIHKPLSLIACLRNLHCLKCMLYMHSMLILLQYKWVVICVCLCAYIDERAILYVTHTKSYQRICV